jgi:hAT family C-terminal dimerisation region
MWQATPITISQVMRREWEFFVFDKFTVEVVTDLCNYWQQKKNVWRDLSSIARGLLGVPATSTSSEKSLNLSGRSHFGREKMAA